MESDPSHPELTIRRGIESGVMRSSTHAFAVALTRKLGAHVRVTHGAKFTVIRRAMKMRGKGCSLECRVE